MLYSFIRPFATVALKVYFKKIFVNQAEAIPKDKPVVFAANHPTAFLDPCLLACIADRPLYFLVRGDVFTKPLYIFLLKSLHMLPMFRLRDGGYAKVKQNFDTFSKCHEALRQNKSIMILAEGRATHGKKLQPIQKGTARVVLGALEKYPDLEEIYIVPVGFNYTDSNRYRSEVMVQMGELIKVRKFAGENQGGVAVNAITGALEQAMKKVVISIDRPEDEPLAESLLHIYRLGWRDTFLPAYDRRQPQRLIDEMKIVDWLNKSTVGQRVNLKQKVLLLDQLLQKHGLDLQSGLEPPVCGVLYHLLILLGIPLAALGRVLNWPAIALGKSITRSKVKRIEFHASVLVSLTMVLMMGYVFLLLVTLSISMGWKGMVIGLLIPLLGYFWVFFDGWRQKVKNACLLKRIPGTELGTIRNTRDEILTECLTPLRY